MNKPKLIADDEVFEELILYTKSYPINFDALEKFYDIGKLELKKITTIQLRKKKNQLKQRYQDNVQCMLKTWMENQYRLFVWFLLAFAEMKTREPENFDDEDWKLIGNFFHKELYVCQYFYFCIKKQKSIPFLPDEDGLIKDLMKTNFSKKWTEIGLELFRITNGKNFRKPKAIRERWLSHLNPQIKKTEWTFDQQLFLIQKIRQFGKKWSKISRLLGNRSQHTVKNHYNKLIQKIHRKYQGTSYYHQYSQDELFVLLYTEFRKKSQETINKKQQNVNSISAFGQTLINLEEVKIQEDLIASMQAFSLPQIFHPIVIVFSGING